MESTRPTSATGDDAASDAPAPAMGTTGRLTDYLSRLDHRVSILTAEGSSNNTAKSASTPEPRTPSRERGRSVSLAQRIQQLIEEEEKGSEQYLGNHDSAEQQELMPDGSLDVAGEQEKAGAEPDACAAGEGFTGGRLRRKSFLPKGNARHSLISVLFRSIDSSSGIGARGVGEEGKQKEEEVEDGGKEDSGDEPWAAEGGAAAAMDTISPSPVLAFGSDVDEISAASGDGDRDNGRVLMSPSSPRSASTLGRPSSHPSPRRQQQQQQQQQPSEEDGNVGDSQQQQQRKDSSRRGTTAASKGAGGGGAMGTTEMLKEELASVKLALRQDLEELHNMVLDVGKRVKEIETDMKQRGKLQAAKDTAQDELMEMEIKQLSRQIEAKLARTEIIDITQMQHQKMKALETSVLGVMEERAQRLQHKLHDELEKVLQQLYNIQQASDKTRRVVEERVKQSTSERLVLQRELQKERRGKEKLQGQVKRLSDRVVQSEVKQTEEALKQREAAREMEERWQQKLTLESADARKEIKALGVAVKEEMGVNVAVIRKERLELKAELLAALQDLDARLAACREELTRQAAETAAAQERKLETLNASLQSAVESRVEGVKAELLARIEELLSLQQANDAKASTAVALQRQEERLGMLHEEALASVDASKREAAERLREKISGVEAAMQESHMQLSQRLSTTVQRLALSEVRGVERHDLLKALLKEVATKLLKEEAEAGLAEDASLHEVIKQLELQRTANASDAARVDQLLVGLTESNKQMRGTVQSLANRNNHGVVLETRLTEHCRSLVDQCVTVQLDAAPSSSSSSAPSGRMPPAQHVILRRETRDFIATNSYRIAKTIASKADYEVIRLLVGRREAMGDEECDVTILRLRETYLHHFMQALAAGVENKHPTSGTPTTSSTNNARHYAASLAIVEARQHFYDKVEQAVRLALSKFARVQVGRSLFGKIGGLGAQGPPPPACVCCDRPFPHDGAARHAAACSLPPTTRQGRQQQQQQALALARVSGVSGNGAMRPTVSNALRPAASVELDEAPPSSLLRASKYKAARRNSNGNGNGNGKAALGPLRPTTTGSRQATYSAVDNILKDYKASNGRFDVGRK